MQTVWFKRCGWLYLPIHPIGFILTLIAILFVLPVSLQIIRSGQKLEENLYHLFVFVTCTAFWWKWIAHKTSN